MGKPARVSLFVTDERHTLAAPASFLATGLDPTTDLTGCRCSCSSLRTLLPSGWRRPNRKAAARRDAERLADWLGAHHLPITVHPGTPAVASIVLTGAMGEIILEADRLQTTVKPTANRRPPFI